MEKLKNVFRPGHGKDDEGMHGNESDQHGVRRQILNPNHEKYEAQSYPPPDASAQAPELGKIETNKDLQNKKEYGVLRQILNPHGEKYDQVEYGTTAHEVPDGQEPQHLPSDKGQHGVLRQIFNPKGEKYSEASYGAPVQSTSHQSVDLPDPKVYEAESSKADHSTTAAGSNTDDGAAPENTHPVAQSNPNFDSNFVRDSAVAGVGAGAGGAGAYAAAKQTPADDTAKLSSTDPSSAMYAERAPAGPAASTVTGDHAIPAHITDSKLGTSSRPDLAQEALQGGIEGTGIGAAETQPSGSQNKILGSVPEISSASTSAAEMQAGKSRALDADNATFTERSFVVGGPPPSSDLSDPATSDFADPASTTSAVGQGFGKPSGGFSSGLQGRPTYTTASSMPHVPGEFPRETGEDPHEARTSDLTAQSGFAGSRGAPLPTIPSAAEDSKDYNATVGVGSGAAVAAAYAAYGNTTGPTPTPATQTRAVPTYQPTTGSAISTTSDPQVPKERQYARDAAVIGSTGAGGYGLYEASKDIQAAEPKSESLPAPEQATTTSQAAPQSLSPEQAETVQDLNYGGDAAVVGGAGAAGAAGYGAHEASKTQLMGSTDAAPVVSQTSPTSQPSSATEQAQPPPERHYGRDAALIGGAAGAAGAGGYGVYEATRDQQAPTSATQYAPPTSTQTTTTSQAQKPITTTTTTTTKPPTTTVTQKPAAQNYEQQQQQPPTQSYAQQNPSDTYAVPVGEGTTTTPRDTTAATSTPDPRPEPDRDPARTSGSGSGPPRPSAEGSAGEIPTSHHHHHHNNNNKVITDSHGHNKLHKKAVDPAASDPRASYEEAAPAAERDDDNSNEAAAAMATAAESSPAGSEKKHGLLSKILHPNRTKREQQQEEEGEGAQQTEAEIGRAI